MSIPIVPCIVSRELSNGSKFDRDEYTDVNHENDFQCSHDYAPNQEFIEKLDKELNGLLKDANIAILIEQCVDSEEKVTWYRCILSSTERSFQGCPMENMLQERALTNVPLFKSMQGIAILLRYLLKETPHLSEKSPAKMTENMYKSNHQLNRGLI